MRPNGGEEYIFDRMTGKHKRRKGGYYQRSQAMQNPENYARQALV